MRVLFWNLQSKPLEKAAARIASEQQADLVLVCEHGGRAGYHVDAMNKHEPARAALRVGPVLKQQSLPAVISRLDQGRVVPVVEDRHCMVLAVTPPAGMELLLACVHLSSPLHQSERDLLLLSQDAVTIIRDQEKQRGHRRTLVVGDFNMDPYHPGMVASHGFHAVMDRRLAMEESRVIQGREHFFFYNPAWSRLGDDSTGPPGTYFYRQASPECHFWHAWDQVLVRPSLLKKFDSSKFVVITRHGSSSMLDGKGRPNTKDFSDHLPIAFEIQT